MDKALRFRVTLHGPAGFRVAFLGLGTFEAGEPREVELTPRQAESLRAKGLAVDRVAGDEPTGEPETGEVPASPRPERRRRKRGTV
jgi:hypothetical protein